MYVYIDSLAMFSPPTHKIKQVKCAREAGVFFTREQVLDWMAQIIEALRYLHHVSLSHEREFVKRALCICQKSPMYMSKEPYVYVKRALSLCQKSRLQIGWLRCLKRSVIFIISVFLTRALSIYQYVYVHIHIYVYIYRYLSVDWMARIFEALRYLHHVSLSHKREFVKRVQRALCICQKSPISMSKEPYLYVQRAAGCRLDGSES